MILVTILPAVSSCFLWLAQVAAAADGPTARDIPSDYFFPQWIPERPVSEEQKSLESSLLSSYMGTTVGMKDMIARSGRKFQLGVMVDVRPGSRQCDFQACQHQNDYDWACYYSSVCNNCTIRSNTASMTTSYCALDPCCDPHPNGGLYVPLLDEPSYQQLLTHDFNSVIMGNAATIWAVNRKQGTYSFDFLDEIVSFARDHSMEAKGQALVYGLGNWLPDVLKSEGNPQDLLLTYFLGSLPSPGEGEGEGEPIEGRMDALLHRYAGEGEGEGESPGRVDRWVGVNEAVRDDAVIPYLLESMSTSDAYCTLQPDHGGLVGSSFPLAAVIESEPVSITGRTGDSIAVTRTAPTEHAAGAPIYLPRVASARLGLDVSDTETQWVLATGDGGLLGSTFPLAATVDLEQISVTGHPEDQPDSINVFRGQGGTTAAAHSKDVRIFGSKLALASAVDDSVTTWTVQQGQFLGNLFPVPAMVDSEPVSVDSRTENTIVVARGAQATAHSAGAAIIPTQLSITDVINYTKNVWPVFTDARNGRAHDISDGFLTCAFDHARSVDANIELVYDDYGYEFASEGGKTNPKFENVKALLQRLVEQETPIDTIGPQMHIPAWVCLVPDSGGVYGLRPNPNQIQGIIDAMTQLAQIVPKIVITEMDINIGIPDDSCNPATRMYCSMEAHVGDIWSSLDKVAREYWQAEVYRAVLNAALSVPQLEGMTFWGLEDEYSWLNHMDRPACEHWPFIEPYRQEGGLTIRPSTASNPCLLGDDPTSDDLQLYWQKPAFWAVREAIENHFGVAFSVKDGSGNELVRFVNNGNVIVLKGEVHESFSAWDSLDLEGGGCFIVRDSEGDDVAVVTSAGEVHLAGTVTEDAQLGMPEDRTAVITKDSQGNVASFIDQYGNLKLRGALIVKGIPYELKKNHSDDEYWASEPTTCSAP
jgi:GH35 family endo-1,4-beta-xylanase